jgi:ligand-binding sensor domain-containing protein
MKSKENILFIMLVAIFIFSCNDEGVTPAKEESIEIIIHNWKTYNTDNSGIPDNQIQALAVDNQNSLWVGTFYNGIARFDGSSWIQYNTQNSGLPNDSIRCITIDKNNNIWVGTGNGLARYDGTNWMVYNTTNSPLPYKVILSLAVEQNNLLWIGCGHATAGGLLTYNGTDWNLYTPENSSLPCGIINVIHVDDNNNKWIGTGDCVYPAGGGLVKIDNHTNWNFYTRPNLLYNAVNTITTDLYGIAWIGYNALLNLDSGYYHGGMQKYDGTNWTDYRSNPNGKYDSTAIVSNRVDVIVCDKYGYLWIATEAEWKFNYNLSVFKNGTWKNLSDISSDFPHPFIRDIKIDGNDIVWLATQIGVISIQYSPKQ